MAAHLVALSAPFTFFLGALAGPLGIWVHKKQLPFIYYHGREAACFNILMAAFIFVLLALGALISGSRLAGLPYWMALALMLAWAFFVVRGGMQARKGELYRYPISSRLVHWWIPKS